MCRVIPGFEVWPFALLKLRWDFLFYFSLFFSTHYSSHLMTSHDNIPYLYLYPLRFTTWFLFWFQLYHSLHLPLGLICYSTLPNQFPNLPGHSCPQTLLTHHFVLFLYILLLAY